MSSGACCKRPCLRKGPEGDEDGEGESETERGAGLDGFDSPEWLQTIRRVRPGIVALRVTAMRAFEDINPGTWYGTGFVVDAAAGLVLTNRHVVTAGPIRAIAYFDQNEELPCEALYRDPCHDFGFMRFDPKALEFTSVVAIPLRPDELTVGTEIRVVGNDNAEKLQILSGTVARVDRNAPQYAGLYSDENTFYVGAASSTSGGSSGSPVLNVQGHAIALNAGGAQDASSAYYLPLDRVVHAVAALQESRVPKRGTVGCRLVFRPYAAAERLGLTNTQKMAAVAANAAAGNQPRRGLLVCDRILPGSACAQAGVEAGDVLLSVDGVCCVDFVHLECAVDAAAPEPWSRMEGGILTMVWARLGQERTTTLRVADLHALVPRDFVDCGAAVFHALSYQRAMKWNVQPQQAGCYVSLAAIFGAVGVGAVITALARNGEKWPTPDLQSLFEALKRIPHDAYFHVSFRDWSGNGHGRERHAEVRMDRRLWPLTMWSLQPALPDRWVVMEDVTSHGVDDSAVQVPTAETDSSVLFEEGRQQIGSSLRNALAEVTFFAHTRLVFEGIKPRGMSAMLFKRRGVGVIVSVEHRLLLTARSTIPQLLGTVEVTFFQSITVDAVPLLIHPELNFVVLQLKGPLPEGVLEVQLLLDAANGVFDVPCRGTFIGLDHRGHAVERECTVATDEVWNPPLLSPPRPRQGVNCELLQALNDEEVSDGLGGVFCLAQSSGNTDTPESQEAAAAAESATALDSPASLPSSASSPSATVAAIFVEFVYDSGPECHYVMGVPAATACGLLKAAILVAAGAANAAPTVPVFPSLELELRELSFADVRSKKGLPASALAKISAWRPERKTVIAVERLLEGGAASQAGLREGDLLLSASEQPLSGPVDLQLALAPHAGNKIPLQVWRGHALHTFEVDVASLPADGVDRCLCWHGMMCMTTPRAYEEVWGKRQGEPRGVTVLSVLLGSPSGEEEGFRSNMRIAAVDGHPIRDLSDLWNHARGGNGSNGLASSGGLTGRGPQASVVVSLVDGDGFVYVRSLCPDPVFWPTVELRLTDSGWVRTISGV